MNAVRKSISGIAVTLCFNACADRNNDRRQDTRKNETPAALQSPSAIESKVLDFSRFETKSFASFSWEKKCEGVAQFVQEFSASYLEKDIDVTYDVENCSLSAITAKSTYFWPKINLIKGSLQLSLIARVDASFDRSTYQLSVNELDLTRVNENSTTPYEFSQKDVGFGANLLHLEKTLKAWLQQEPNGVVSVFGIPYAEFVKDAEKKYGPDSPGLKIEDDKPMTIQLLATEQSVGTGTVKFLSVDQSVFLYTGLDGKEASRLFLGCPDITCLNNSTIGYEFLGNSLVISTPAVVDGGKSTTYIFKLLFDSWE